VPPTVLLLPGLGGSEAGHWQTRWQALHPEYVRVEQASWHAPRRLAWVIRLEAAVRAAAGPVILVAHSLAGPLVAHWARRGSVQRVAAALLVAPADVERPDAPAAVRDFAPLPLERLPFTTWLVASSDDPHASVERSRQLAAAWGARLLEAGAVGHINVASGHGPWPTGEALLDELRRGATRRRGANSTFLNASTIVEGKETRPQPGRCDPGSPT
jgi:predicted alpha/beta hydrolase family esterase